MQFLDQIFGIYRKKYWKYRYYVWSCLAALAVVFYFIKRGSADGRTLIWMASLTSWLHDIWFGVGVGGFRNACAEGIAEMWNAKPQSIMFESAGVTDCSYNALLNVLVEQGLIGAILCVATVVLAMVRLFKQSVRAFDLEQEWNEFRDGCYAEIARQWCSENEIEYEE